MGFGECLVLNAIVTIFMVAYLPGDGEEAAPQAIFHIAVEYYFYNMLYTH